MPPELATAPHTISASFFQKRRPVFLFLALITLFPIAVVHVAGLGDTLNHLARMHILATIATSPDLQRFYQVSWQPIPYLAMDAILPPLLHILPIYVVGRLFVAVCLLLPVLAATALHCVIHHRASLVPAAAFLLSYNQLVSLGFLNYLFSASLAVLLFAAWIATAAWPRWPRAAAFAPLVTLLYFGHVFACLAYCLCIAGWEGARALRARPILLAPVIADIAAALLQAVPAMAMAATLNVGAGYIGQLHTVFGGVPEKVVALTSPLLFRPDSANAAVLVVIIVLAGAFARHLRVAPALWPSGALLFIVSLAIPHLMASTWGTDLRLPFVATLVLISATSWRPTPICRFAKPLLLAALILLAAVKSIDAWRVLAYADVQVAQTREILANLPRGARLLVVNAPRGAPGATPPDPSTQWQLPMVAVIDHDAFLPTIFTGLSTVHVRPLTRTSSTPNGFLITPAQLRAGQTLYDTPGEDIPDGPGGGRLYHYGWPGKFDFVLIQRFGTDPGKLPVVLTPVAHSADMDLYRIAR